jgi:hypothetical protein
MFTKPLEIACEKGQFVELGIIWLHTLKANANCTQILQDDNYINPQAWVMS